MNTMTANENEFIRQFRDPYLRKRLILRIDAAGLLDSFAEHYGVTVEELQKEDA